VGVRVRAAGGLVEVPGTSTDLGPAVFFF
jgi:hypothetical protein